MCQEMDWDRRLEISQQWCFLWKTGLIWTVFWVIYVWVVIRILWGVKGCCMGCRYSWWISEEESRVRWCCAVSCRPLLTLRPWQTMAALIGGSPEGEVDGAQGAMTDARSSEHHWRITAWRGGKVFILVALGTETICPPCICALSETPDIQALPLQRTVYTSWQFNEPKTSTSEQNMFISSQHMLTFYLFYFLTSS